MFVSEKVYQSLARELANERGKREILERDAAGRQAMLDFLCARVNALEVERAVLLKAATSIDMPIPTVSVPAPLVPGVEDAVSAIPSMFEDMGDAEARKQGVRWDKGGAVEYGHGDPVPARRS